MPRYRMNAFDRELVQALQREDLDFDMSAFCKKGSEAESPSCGTALCMAGHIVGTLRPAMARALIKFAPDRFTSHRYMPDGSVERVPDYQRLALDIYEVETGQPCTLDFFAFEGPGGNQNIEQRTRKEAIAHIRGRSKRWPRVGGNWGNY